MEKNIKKKIFISHIADEHAEAEQAKEFLEKAFGVSIEVFSASSWSSIQPGDDWFDRIENAISSADLVLVFASTDSVNRPWISFETGAAWFSKKKVIPVCHKGMTPSALPEPIRRLQAIDINAPNAAESLSKLVEAVRVSIDLPVPKPVALDELSIDTGRTGAVSIRGWTLRPSAHIEEVIEDVFKVGTVDSCDASRAIEAGLDPNDCIYVRLYAEPTSVGPGLTYINAIASGNKATFFEQRDIVGKPVSVKLRLKATHQIPSPGEPRLVPIIVIESVRFSGVA